MQVPLQVQFRNIEQTERLESLLEKKVRKLELLHDHLTSCRVAVERPHIHESSVNPFRVRIDVTVPPGQEVVVSKDPSNNPYHADLETVIINAFQAAERQLKEIKQRLKGEVKTHPEPTGVVVRIFQEKGYGFLKTSDGTDVFFHRHSVTNDDFHRLEVGTKVRYVQQMGEKGPQASTVQIVDKPGSRRSSDEKLQPPPGWERHP